MAMRLHERPLQPGDPVVWTEDDAVRLLQNNRELFAVVREAVAQLHDAFHSRIEVTYFEDHEDERAAPYVVVTALPRCSFERAHATMDNVRDRWLLPNMHRADGRFALDVHPVA